MTDTPAGLTTWMAKLRDLLPAIDHVDAGEGAAAAEELEAALRAPRRGSGRPCRGRRADGERRWHGPHAHPGEINMCFPWEGGPLFDGLAPGWVVWDKA